MVRQIMHTLRVLARSHPAQDNAAATQVEGELAGLELGGRFDLTAALSRLLSILHTANVGNLPPPSLVGGIALDLRRAGYGIRDWSEDQGTIRMTLPGQQSEVLIRLELATKG